MSITKKSLISNRGASKKAIVTKPEVNKISATKLSLNRVAVKPTSVALKPTSVAVKPTSVAVKPTSVSVKSTRVVVN